MRAKFYSYYFLLSLIPEKGYGEGGERKEKREGRGEERNREASLILSFSLPTFLCWKRKGQVKRRRRKGKRGRGEKPFSTKVSDEEKKKGGGFVEMQIALFAFVILFGGGGTEGKKRKRKREGKRGGRKTGVGEPAIGASICGVGKGGSCEKGGRGKGRRYFLSSFRSDATAMGEGGGEVK